MENVERLGCIYVQCDLDAELDMSLLYPHIVIRYVGQTIAYKKRYSAHKNSVYTKGRNYADTWRKSCKNFHMYIVEDNIPRSQLNDREEFWIKKLKDEGHKLTNDRMPNDQGEFKYSERTRKTHNEKLNKRTRTPEEMERWRKRVVRYSEESKRKRSETMKLKWKDPNSPFKNVSKSLSEYYVRTKQENPDVLLERNRKIAETLRRVTPSEDV